MVSIIKPVLIDVSLSMVYPEFILEYPNHRFVLSRVNSRASNFDYAPSITRRLDYIKNIIKMPPKDYFLENNALVEQCEIEPCELFYAVAGCVDAVKTLDYRINADSHVQVENISGKKLDIEKLVEILSVTDGWFEGLINGSYAELLRTYHDKSCPRALKVPQPEKIVFDI